MGLWSVRLIPAALYSLQNGLQYVAASNLDVSASRHPMPPARDAQVCQVLYQPLGSVLRNRLAVPRMKLVTTALFSALTKPVTCDLEP